MNKAEKSLRWVVNQIPDFKPTTNEEKMLVAIKLYSEAGAEEIKRLEVENAALRERLSRAVEFPCKPGDTIYWLCEDEKTIHEGIVVNFDIEESGIWVFCKYYKDDFTYWHTLECFCEDVYTDKTEAESRLAELKGEKKNG